MTEVREAREEVWEGRRGKGKKARVGETEGR